MKPSEVDVQRTNYNVALSRLGVGVIQYSQFQLQIGRVDDLKNISLALHTALHAVTVLMIAEGIRCE